MKLSSIAKYVDQPLIVKKISNAAPAVLAATAIGLGIYDSFIKKHNDEKKQARLWQNAIVLTTVAGASLVASRGLKLNGKKVFDGLIESEPTKNILKKQKAAVQNFMEGFTTKDSKLNKILQKVKNRPLNPLETDYIIKNLNGKKGTEKLFDTIFGKKENLTSSEIFSEIGRLSLLGLVPVLAGVGSGMLFDRTPSKKQNNSDRIKEGFYQYFANIFLCNVGAGAALFGLEALKNHGVVKNITPMKKFGAMICGIVATGIIGGSFIANYMSKKIIDPIVLHKKEKHLTIHKIYDERTPESLDMAMHLDDIATAGVLSGFKWIEPILPVFYLFSGYRAGMGYRNQNRQIN